MHHLESIMEVHKRADKLRKKSLASDHDIYFHAINDFMSKKRKKMDPDRAEQLQAYLHRNFGLG